ncbi:MAG: hypothetical protein HKO63_12095 [Acidimicrobiia bacterium]|nr:hypothetical protein [Acidimicrobiia bacterium]NNL98937.1 hypothetical protein [Acidimicrobiia bacterium]
MTKRSAVAMLVVMLVAAGCSSGEADGAGQGVASLEGPTETTVPADGDGTQDVEEAMIAFTECLRNEGLEVEDPEFDDAGEFRFNMPMGEFMQRMSQQESREAFNACSHLLMGVVQQFGGFGQTQMEDQLYEYAACMRENGFDMPDPDFSNPGVFDPEADAGTGPFSQVDTTDPAFRTANEACQGVFADNFRIGESEDGQ